MTAKVIIIGKGKISLFKKGLMVMLKKILDQQFSNTTFLITWEYSPNYEYPIVIRWSGKPTHLQIVDALEWYYDLPFIYSNISFDTKLSWEAEQFGERWNRLLSYEN